MQKLHYTTTINSPVEKVWNTMLDDETYRQWSSEFASGSHYDGSWTPGTTMRFVAPDPDGTVSGMLSEIKEVRPYEFVSIQNIGEIKKGEEFPFTPEQTEGQAMYENYTFEDKGGVTELTIEVDSTEEFRSMFEEMWPRALAKLKSIAEQNS